jgi:hypothetical protein
MSKPQTNLSGRDDHAGAGRPRIEQDDERGGRRDGDTHPRHGQKMVAVAMQHRVPARVERGSKEHDAAGITEHAGCGPESERETKSAMQLAGYLSCSDPTNQIICEIALDKLFRMKRVLPPLNALRAFEAADQLGSFKEAAAELVQVDGDRERTPGERQAKLRIETRGPAANEWMAEMVSRSGKLEIFPLPGQT